MDPTTTDERAWALAPLLVASLIGQDFTVWLNPGTGTTCRLEASGDYEIRRVVAGVPKPVVLGQVAATEALALMKDPHTEATLRAIAQAMVPVEATA